MAGNNCLRNAVNIKGKWIGRGRFAREMYMALHRNRNLMIQKVRRMKATRGLVHTPFYAENGGENRSAKCGVGDEIWWNTCWGLHGRILERL